MQRISITNPQNVIDGTAKKYYFKLRNTGGPKGDKGDKGDTGATGPQGPQGNAATVSVGSTTTLPVGYDATVTNSGSIYNAVLDFGIPQGPQGPQGAKGDKGDTGAQGETGPRGPQGERGTNATVYVGTTTTTNPGTQARVYNSGTDSNAVLNFEIPRGDVGPQPELVQTTGTSTTKAMSQNATTVALATKQNTIDSSHKLSADLVDDTSTTNKFVTASEKATWNAKQNTLTAGDNIEITGDTISTPAIVPEVVAELPTAGAEGKLYLTPKNYTRSTATGNPISATITDGAGQIESFQLNGDTYQQSYTGKNLYNESTSTDNWVNQDGELRPNDFWRSSQLIKVTPGSTFTISGEQIVDGFVQLLWAGYDASQGFITGQRQQINQINNVTFTVGASSEYIRVGYRKDALKNIQLELGSTATTYEPYVGGTPSPNPDYPQPIQTVTGEQTVTIVGKNLISANWESGRYNNSTGAKEPYSDNVRTDTPIAVQPSKTYICSRNGSGLAMNILQYEADGSFISATTISSGNSFTTGANTYFVTMFRGTSGGTEGIQLELGSTITAYAPYSATSYPINLGKNLFDNTGWEQGQYTNGVWGDGNTKRATSGFIPITGGAYTMSLNSTDNKTALINLNYFDGNKAWLGNRSNLGLEIFGYTDRVKTFTLPNNASYLRVTVRPYGGDDQGDNIIQYAPSENLQLEAGSQATAYASYKTPIELCKLGDYQDYIYKSGSDWKVHKATNKFRLDGSEEWRYYNTVCQLYNITDYAISNNIPFCVAFKGVSNVAGLANVADNTCCFINVSGSTTPRFYVRYSDKFTSAQSIADYLTSNPTNLYYSLATATDTTITDQTLIAQLEAVRTASLETGANTITNSAAGSNLAGDMEIGYYEYNPTNRYDKFIWLDLNNNYEQIGE